MNILIKTSLISWLSVYTYIIHISVGYLWLLIGWHWAVPSLWVPQLCDTVRGESLYHVSVSGSTESTYATYLNQTRKAVWHLLWFVFNFAAVQLNNLNIIKVDFLLCVELKRLYKKVHEKLGLFGFGCYNYCLSVFSVSTGFEEGNVNTSETRLNGKIPF